MNNNEFNLQREVREMKAEVRRLKRLVEGILVVVGLGVVIIFPRLLLFALVIPAAVLVGLLVSPVRRLIFLYIFGKRDGHEYDA